MGSISDVAVVSPEPLDLSPAKRNPHLNHAENWLRLKNKLDKIDPSLWRIQDNLYDFTKFAEKHPGTDYMKHNLWSHQYCVALTFFFKSGAEWINMTKGTDITEAFEVVHVQGNSNKNKILEKYFVRSCAEVPRSSFYTFEADGFYMTLKRSAQKVLAQVGSGPSTEMLLIQDGLAILFHLLLLLSIHFQSVLAVVLAGITLGMNMSSSHNFFHQGDNFRRFYWDLTMLSSHDWRITHMLSHHIFTNTYSDFEVSVLFPIFDILPSTNKHWVHRYLAPIYYHVALFVIGPFEYLKKGISILVGSATPRPENAIPLAQLALFWTMSTLPLSTTFWHWILIHCLAGYWLAFTSITTTHHHPQSYHAGDLHLKSADWGLQQLDAVTDIERPSLFVAVTTFKHHALHHLFPTVDHSKLRYLYPALEQTCKEFGMCYKHDTAWNLFCGFHWQLMRNVPTNYEERLAMKN